VARWPSSPPDEARPCARNSAERQRYQRRHHVNCSRPDAQLDKFVDTLARRISSFDKQAIGEIKHFVDTATRLPDSKFAAQWQAFITSVQRPAAQHHIKALMDLGLQKKPDVEIHLPRYTGEVNQPGK
jgi:hypothetical protein